MREVTNHGFILTGARVWACLSRESRASGSHCLHLLAVGGVLLSMLIQVSIIVPEQEGILAADAAHLD